MPSTSDLSKFIKKNGFLIIDSNIFFKVDYRTWLIDLFNKISFYDGKIQLFDIQIDEIKNLTFSKDKNEAYSARGAMRFIETQLDRNLIDVVNSYKPEKYHVDKLILEEVEKTKNRKIILITDDKELRIKSTKFDNKSNLSTYNGNGVFVGVSASDFLMAFKEAVSNEINKFLSEKNKKN